MSHQTFDIIAEKAYRELRNVKAREDSQLDTKPVKDKSVVIQILTKNITEYKSIYRKLSVCFDQIVRPQERIILKRLMETVMGRLIEIKNEIVNHDLKNYQSYAELFVDIKMIPNDFTIPVPAHIKEATSEQKTRKQRLEKMIEQIEFLKSHFEKDDLMGHELAVLILQKQERARQGQIRALCMKKIQFNERRRLNVLNKEYLNTLNFKLVSRFKQQLEGSYRDVEPKSRDLTNFLFSTCNIYQQQNQI